MKMSVEFGDSSFCFNLICRSIQNSYSSEPDIFRLFNSYIQRVCDDLSCILLFINQGVDVSESQLDIQHQRVLNKFPGCSVKNYITEQMKDDHQSYYYKPNLTTAYQLYAMLVEIFASDFITLKRKDNFQLNFLIDSAAQDFELIMSVLNNYYEDGAILWETNQHHADKEIISHKSDQFIIETLLSYLFFLFNDLEDGEQVQMTYQILGSIHLISENSFQQHNNILPEELSKVILSLPKMHSTALLKYYSECVGIDEIVYKNLLFSINSSNINRFSNDICKYNLYPELLLYYDFYRLFVIIKNQVIKAEEIRESSWRKSNDSIAEREFNSESVLRLIKTCYVNLILNIKSKKDNYCIIASTLIAIYDHIYTYCKYSNLLEVVEEQFDLDDVIRNRVRLYRRLNYFRFGLDYKQEELKRNKRKEPKKTKTVKNNDTGSKLEKPQRSFIASPADTNKEFNCKIPEKDLDPFLDYLVWRGYIKEGDQASFKYDAFGGHKPIDYRHVSFNFDATVGKKMLGVILYKLRYKADDPIRLYNEKITQSNSQITTGNDSMRVFVDFGLFFPDLIDTLKMGHSNLEPIRQKLIERVQKLSESDEYNNCSSILEFIQQHEKKNYWVISKKKEILGR